MTNCRQTASVVPPLCLVITVIAALLFSLLEAARFDGLSSDAKEFTNLAAESLFAGYQPYLFRRYGMFFLDGCFGSGTFDLAAAEDAMASLLYDNLTASKEADGINAYRMDVSSIRAERYRLITDEDGAVFAMQAAGRMKEKISEQAARAILNRLQDAKDEKDIAPDPEQAIENADRAAEEAKQQAEEAGQAQEAHAPQEEEAAAVPAVESPLDTIKGLRRQGILSLVLPAGMEVSAKRAPDGRGLQDRQKETGNYPLEEHPGWYEKVLMQEFVKSYAQNAVSPNQSGALSYGTEYLICGRDSDEENLKQTVHRLLFLREIFNFLYLKSDAAKSAEALSVAAAVAGVSANPLVVSAVQHGILAAWAYVESLCDVKALLAGGKIPLMKNAGNFRTTLAGLGSALSVDYRGEREGLSYENYLDLLLYEISMKKMAYRGMDLMEWDMRNQEIYGDCRMDHMIVGMKVSAGYDANVLFLGIFGEDKIGAYQFAKQAEYVYEP